MPVSEYGEIGVLVKDDPDSDMVIHWRVRKVAINTSDNIWGKKGDNIYYTSLGWVVGLPDKSDYFAPTERERSLRPCILRAIKYSNEHYPGKRGGTH